MWVQYIAHTICLERLLEFGDGCKACTAGNVPELKAGRFLNGGRIGTSLRCCADTDCSGKDGSGGEGKGDMGADVGIDTVGHQLWLFGLQMVSACCFPGNAIGNIHFLEASPAK